MDLDGMHEEIDALTSLEANGLPASQSNEDSGEEELPHKNDTFVEYPKEEIDPPPRE